MNSKYSLAILATVAIMVFLFLQDKKARARKVPVRISEEHSAPRKVIRPIEIKSLPASADLKPVALKAASAEVTAVDENVQKIFSMHLKAMAKCLKLTGEPNIAEKSDPTVENLMASLRASFGEVVVQMDDWSQTEILEQGTVRKRVRVDYDYFDGANSTKRLSLYQINSYGMPEIVNLTADEVNNPNEAYVLSLIEGHKVIAEEKGARSYFHDGEELIFSTRNEKLQSISINKADRSFNCFNLDEESSSCSCP